MGRFSIKSCSQGVSKSLELGLIMANYNKVMLSIRIKDVEYIFDSIFNASIFCSVSIELTVTFY